MDSLYALLGLSENVSREELKMAFLAWKRQQQTILRSGTKEEQDAAADRITQATVLYKVAVGRTDFAVRKAKMLPPEKPPVAPKPIARAPHKEIMTASANMHHEQWQETNHAGALSDEPTSDERQPSASGDGQMLPPQQEGQETAYHASQKHQKNFIVAGLALSVVFAGIIFGLTHNRPTAPAATTVPRHGTATHGTGAAPKSTNPSSAQHAPAPSQSHSAAAKPSNPVGQPATTSDPYQGKTPAQRDAIRVLYSFHVNITHKEFRQAYQCLSKGLQSRIPYEGWVSGFRTTVSSTPSDVKVASESDGRIVLSYNLRAVDNPGGTQNFMGTAVLIRTNEGWKLDDIANKVK